VKVFEDTRILEVGEVGRERAMPKRKLQEDEMKRRLAEDDTEGHMKRRLDNDEMKRRLEGDDTEGHMKRRLDNEMKRRADEEDDTEGHRLVGRSLDSGEGDEIKYT
jgi:hypothetical protein